MGAGRGSGLGGDRRRLRLDLGSPEPAPGAGTPPAMEGPSVLGPCSWHKRRAWVRQSRGWGSPEPGGEREEEEEEEEEQQEEQQEVAAVPSEPPPHLDPGSVGSKIRTGMRDRRAHRDRQLSLGDSTASTVPSNVPTTSSLSQLLSRCRCDAEDILLELGFVGSEPGVAARVPPRFFSAPSRASGIDLGLFLRAQERRQSMEDPSARLAGRFQQLQALAATADAFFCLYSRTPLQRPGPPRPYRDMAGDSPELRLCTGGGDSDIPRGATPGATPTTSGAGGLRKDPGAWRRDRDTGATQRLSPRSRPAGTAWGHPERCCPRGRGVWGSRGVTAAQGDPRDTRGDVTALGVTPEQPGPPRGHPGLGSWWHQSGTARGGGDGAGTPERVPKTRDPRGAAESFEMEEVLSEDDDDDDDDGDDDDDDDDDEAARSPHPALRTPRRSPFPGLSDSSGFSEGPLPPWTPPAL